MAGFYKGEIYYIYPRETVGCEQTGGRPGIIVSNDMGNEYSKVVEVVFLTTRDKKPLPTHVEINSAKCKSIALCEQIETVSKERIGSYINNVSMNEMKKLNEAMMISLGIDVNVKGTKLLKEWEKLIAEWETEEVAAESEAVPEKKMEAVIPIAEETNPPKEAEKIDVVATPEFIKVSAERDVYKELYMNLLKEK